MKVSDRALTYVASLLVPQEQCMSYAALAYEDEEDARAVKANMALYGDRYKPIEEQLKHFSGFHGITVTVKRNYARARSLPGGIIEFDFATLKKKTSMLAWYLAHEWGHHCLNHVESDEVPEREAEKQADYWAGLFLGYNLYPLEELIKEIITMPELDTVIYGSRFERACIIVDGYYAGQKLREGNMQLSAYPGLEAYRSQHSSVPWQHCLEEQAGDQFSPESNAFNPSK